MSERFRIYHVRNNTLVKTYLFDIGVTTSEANYTFPGQSSASVSGACSLLCSSSGGRMTECPPGVPTITNKNEAMFSLHDAGMGSLFNFADAQIGDKLYLGKWDVNHSYITITNKVQSVTPGSRGDYTLTLSYFTCDDELVYSNVGWTCQFISSRNVIYLGSLPWLWKWDNPTSFTLTRIEIYNYHNQSTPYFCNGFIGNASPTTMALGRKFWEKVPIVDTGNPYEPGGTSGEGDPTPGNFSEDSDDIDDDGLPDENNTGAVGTGFATIFTPTKAQLTNLANVMWGNDIISFLQNQVENIKDMFVSLGIVPFRVTPGANRNVMWLGLIDTAITLTTAANQFYDLDMGSINMADDPRIYTSNSALDYAPFSKLGIYLPFIGFQELDIDECRNATIGLHYKIDILSGSCVAWIYLNGNPVYQFSGNCMTQIPLTGQDAQTLFTNAVNVGIAAAGAATNAAVAGGGDSGTPRSGNGVVNALNEAAGSTDPSAFATESHLASATANGMMGMKPTYKKSGAVSASTSLLSVKQPYLFLTTPRQCIPERYQKYCGFPSNITGKLGDFSGYTVVEDIRLNGLVATSVEVEEIYKLLKTGVII